ncbi:hypothetical protein P2R64_32280 [Priestia megaterium]|uniref:hypothetical protein n=1 Tax=Priestia megaterium TaxID=1404 RepID=UPI0023DA94A0|nr:hypothetical protein [Priestia megaterium]MDF1964682.1 hypothetical protein [Priestia megaterium]
MRKTQWFDFRNFLHKPSLSSSIKPRPFKAYSFVPFSPVAMLDPTILTVGGIVLGIAFIEQVLIRLGAMDLAGHLLWILTLLLCDIYVLRRG